MIARILVNTPPWVWGLLLALILLGVSQTRPRRLTPAKLLILPLAMTLFSLAGTLTSLGFAPLLLAAWAAAGACGACGCTPSPPRRHRRPRSRAACSASRWEPWPR